MLQIKPNSVLIPDVNLDEELKQHAQLLLEKSQQIIKQKIQKIQSKDAKVQTIQKNFVEWAGQKQAVWKQKLQKSSKNKYEHLQKIVKKCKDHKKYLGQKLKIYHSKNRKTLKQAWKKSQELKANTQLYYNSKNASFQRMHNQTLNQINNEMSQSLYITQKSHNINKYQEDKQYLALNYAANHNNNSFSKVYNNNASKQYWNQINRSIHPFKPQELAKIPAQEQKNDEKNINKTNQKLKETIARFKLYSQQMQENKIQQLGQKLEKIERNRLKKLESFKKKNDSSSRVSNYASQEKKEKKKVQKKNFRIHSESVVKQKRVHDFSQLNRQKRDEYQQNFIQNSNQYIQSQKIRQLKTSITKKIANSTIEKKLFYERLIIH